MKKKLFLFLLLLTTCVTTLSGCWDYVELEDVSIVTGFAVDKNEKGEYLLTVEIVDVSQEEKEAKINAQLLESSGSTLLDAIRNAFKTTAPVLYWGHAEIIIFSQEVAREGIIDIIDFVHRSPKLRTNIRLLVSREKTAKEILESASITTNIRSFEIREMIELHNKFLKVPDVQMNEFINDLSAEGISPVLAAVRLIEVKGKKTSQLSGTAVFKKDKFIGFLDEEETKFLHFVKENCKGGLIIVEDGSEEMKTSIDISKSKVKLKPVYSGNKLTMNIRVSIEGTLDEYRTKNNYYYSSDDITALEKKAEEQLAEDIRRAIRKLQEDFNADILGFGSTVKAEMPKLWKKIGNQWDDMFKNIDVNVEISMDIYNSGLLYKKIKVGD